MSTARLCLNYLLRALELPQGSEVLMTPLTIADMVNMVRAAGHRPVFVDMETGAFNVDVADLERKVSSRSRVLLVTHLMGLVPDMGKILEVARRHNLLVVEDFSQNYGSTYQGKKMGTFGIAGIASVSMMKTICGYLGGVCCTDDPVLYRKFRAIEHEEVRRCVSRWILIKLFFKNLLLFVATDRLLFSLGTFYVMRILNAWSPQVVSNFQRANINMLTGEPDPLLRDSVSRKLLFSFSDLQAELVLDCLRKVDGQDRKRKELVRCLYEVVDKAYHRYLPRPIDWDGSVFWRFSVMTQTPEDFRRFLSDRYIDSGLTNLCCCSAAEEFAVYHRGRTPVAPAVRDNAVLIPIHSEWTMADMRWLGAAINQYHQNAAVGRGEAIPPVPEARRHVRAARSGSDIRSVAP
jgi:dTDP-4-amino-4,6-dideoxygalactose transaminase